MVEDDKQRRVLHGCVMRSSKCISCAVYAAGQFPLLYCAYCQNAIFSKENRIIPVRGLPVERLIELYEDETAT